LFETAMLSL